MYFPYAPAIPPVLGSMSKVHIYPQTKLTHKPSRQILWYGTGMPSRHPGSRGKATKHDLAWPGEFITVLFLPGKRWGNPKCLANKWRDKMCSIHKTSKAKWSEGDGWLEHLPLWQRTSLVPSTHVRMLTAVCNSSSGGAGTQSILHEHPYVRVHACAHTNK